MKLYPEPCKTSLDRILPANRPSLALGLLLAMTACDSDFTVTETSKELSIYPEFLDLGVVSVGDSLEFALRLDSIKGPDAEIRDVDLVVGQGDFFQLSTDLGSEPLDVPSGGEAFLDFVYSPTEEGYHWVEVNIISDASNSDLVSVVRGQAVETSLSVWPMALDFGQVEPSDFALRELTLENQGLAAITLVAAEFSDSVFSLDAELPMELGAGEMLVLDLRFDPQDSQPAHANMTMDFSPGVPDLVPVSLSGNDCENGDVEQYDQDSDGWALCGGDCDDSDPDVNPGGTEQANGVDDDCDGIIDEGTEAYDDDGDCYCEQAPCQGSVSESCPQVLGGDCSDGDITVSPVATEDFNNGVDDDCDGVIDSGAADADGDGYGVEGGDCDDYDSSSYPGATELADWVDNDCDGTIDEGTEYYDDDGDGHTEAAGDCDDGDSSVYPGASERADWIDNDCDGQVDEGTVNADDDGDGFTDGAGGDCDDSDASVNPAAQEISGDGIDNDCDGVVD